MAQTISQQHHMQTTPDGQHHMPSNTKIITPHPDTIRTAPPGSRHTPNNLKRMTSHGGQRTQNSTCGTDDTTRKGQHDTNTHNTAQRSTTTSADVTIINQDYPNLGARNDNEEPCQEMLETKPACTSKLFQQTSIPQFSIADLQTPSTDAERTLRTLCWARVRQSEVSCTRFLRRQPASGVRLGCHKGAPDCPPTY